MALLIAGAPGTASIKVSGRPCQVEGKSFQRRAPICCSRVVEGSVARGRIAFLEADFDLDCMLVIRAPEAAERMLRLSRITIAQDDETAF